jgi:hypothetical protein
MRITRDSIAARARAAALRRVIKRITESDTTLLACYHPRWLLQGCIDNGEVESHASCRYSLVHASLCNPERKFAPAVTSCGFVARDDPRFHNRDLNLHSNEPLLVLLSDRKKNKNARSRWRGARETESDIALRGFSHSFSRDA